MDIYRSPCSRPLRGLTPPSIPGGPLAPHNSPRGRERSLAPSRALQPLRSVGGSASLPVQPSDAPTVSLCCDSTNISGCRQDGLNSPEPPTSSLAADCLHLRGTGRLEIQLDLSRGAREPFSKRLEVGFLPRPAREKGEQALILG